MRETEATFDLREEAWAAFAEAGGVMGGLPDGTARLTGEVLRLDGITAELLRWRRHARVLGVPALRARMREELTTMLALYSSAP